MNLKRLVVSSCLATVMFTQTLFASEYSGFIWNEDTNEAEYYGIEELMEMEETEEIIDQIEQDIQNNQDNDAPTIKPRAELKTFLRYDQKSTSRDNKAKYVGSARVDNRNGSQSATISFTATNSGTWTVGVSGNLSGKTEINAVVAKVDATVSIGGTVSRSWSSGRTYGSSSTVPAGSVLTLEAYMVGTYTSGDLVYSVYDTYDGKTYTYRYPVGTAVPSKNDWNFVYLQK